MIDVAHRPFALALLIVGLSFGLRLVLTFSDPVFDLRDSVGLVKSDPALILYVVKRIVAAGGGIPEDFRADPRVEHPELSDLPAIFTVGQEFPVAWAHLLTGQAFPLHVVATVVMSFTTSLIVLGVFGLAREIAGSARAGLLAALLWGVMRSSYRTLGFVIVREDFAIPFLALHFFALARAVRTDSTLAWAVSALLLGAALSTWHAMGFVVALEFGILLLASFWTGRNPFVRAGPWVFPAILLVFTLTVPVLSTKLFVLSPAMGLLAGLCTAGLVTRARRAPTPMALGMGATAAGFLVVMAASRWLGTSDYAHVFDLMLAKLRFLGELPDDPTSLSFGARLLWQGPFATADPWGYVDRVGLPLLALPLALVWRDRRPELVTLWLGTAVAVVLAIVVVRLSILSGLLLPVLAGVLASRPPPALRAWRWRSAALAALILGQALWFGISLSNKQGGWNNPVQVREMRAAFQYIRDHVPPDAAVATDFINGAAVLADSGRRILLQPKLETRRTRDRVEAFVMGLYRSPPEQFSRLLSERFQARYLLVDWPTLWRWRYKAGLPLSARRAPSGSAAEHLINRRPEQYGFVPGFELVYVSPEQFLRVYRIDAP